MSDTNYTFCVKKGKKLHTEEGRKKVVHPDEICERCGKTKVAKPSVFCEKCKKIVMQDNFRVMSEQGKSPLLGKKELSFI